MKPSAIALVASGTRLSQYHVYHWICEGVANTHDTMVVGISQPEEFSIADGRDPKDTGPKRNQVVHSEYGEGCFALIYCVDWNRVFGQW